ncbi:hypothetical protein ACRAWF_17045 [Streptomyces sp. L7]
MPTAGATARTAWHLPAGAWWTDAWTGETYEGGTRRHGRRTADRIPLFLRSRATLPVAE